MIRWALFAFLVYGPETPRHYQDLPWEIEERNAGMFVYKSFEECRKAGLALKPKDMRTEWYCVGRKIVNVKDRYPVDVIELWGKHSYPKAD